jgi:hypothetical protein
MLKIFSNKAANGIERKGNPMVTFIAFMLFGIEFNIGSKRFSSPKTTAVFLISFSGKSFRIFPMVFAFPIAFGTP